MIALNQWDPQWSFLKRTLLWGISQGNDSYSTYGTPWRGSKETSPLGNKPVYGKTLEKVYARK